jgi:hypothetical protein
MLLVRRLSSADSSLSPSEIQTDVPYTKQTVLVYTRQADGCRAQLAQQTDCLGRQGHTSHQMKLVSLCRLAVGAAYRDMDDNSRMSVESLRSSFKLFVSTVLLVLGMQYLNREPTDDDV